MYYNTSRNAIPYLMDDCMLVLCGILYFIQMKDSRR